jgi:hypothetical protein
MTNLLIIITILLVGAFVYASIFTMIIAMMIALDD